LASAIALLQTGDQSRRFWGSSVRLEVLMGTGERHA
jgi:hypothetical protein